MRSTYSNDLYRSGGKGFIFDPIDAPATGAGRPAVLCVPGHGGTAEKWMGLGSWSWLRHFQALTTAGATVIATDGGGLNKWGNADNMAALDAMYVFAVARGHDSIVGLFGHSMAAMELARWHSLNSEKVRRSVLVAPPFDLVRQHDTHGATIDAAHPGGYAYADPMQNTCDYKGLPMVTWHGDADASVPVDVSQAFQAEVTSMLLFVVEGATHVGVLNEISPSSVVDYLLP